MNAAQHGATYKDLVYVRRRYITADQLRQAIAIVTNGTLIARDPAIWGEGTTACASDSKHFGPWDQNLTTQWRGVTGKPPLEDLITARLLITALRNSLHQKKGGADPVRCHNPIATIEVVVGKPLANSVPVPT